ncbi:MAG: twin-arginine translocase TatA/TatE family subunit [Staphylococcus sp.]|nr:twin-arginine translocase TatA/TatE family subunit [Staphylococcus sp.]
MTPCFLNLGTGELIIIFVVILLLFGAKRIPDLARSMGKGISQFKQGMNDAVSEINSTPGSAAADKDAKAETSSSEKAEK